MDRAEKIEQLRRKIEDAFADAKYPGDDSLVEWKDWESVDLARLLKGKHWKDLTLDMMNRESGALYLLTPQAFRFYLPAYLIGSLLHHEYWFAEVVSYVLMPPEGKREIDENELAWKGETEQYKYIVKRFEKTAGRLTKEQKSAVRFYWEFLRDEHSEDYPDDAPEIALKTYWGEQ